MKRLFFLSLVVCVFFIPSVFFAAERTPIEEIWFQEDINAEFKTLESLPKGDPKRYSRYSSIIAMYYNTGNKEKAYAAAAQLTEEFPNWGCIETAILYMNDGEFDKAITLLEEGVIRFKDDFLINRIRYRLNLAYSLIGYTDKGLRYWFEGNEDSPNMRGHMTYIQLPINHVYPFVLWQAFTDDREKAEQNFIRGERYPTLWGKPIAVGEDADGNPTVTFEGNIFGEGTVVCALSPVYREQASLLKAGHNTIIIGIPEEFDGTTLKLSKCRVAIEVIKEWGIPLPE